MSKENSVIDRAKYALENQIGWQRYATSKILLLFTLSGGTLVSLINGIDIKNIDEAVTKLPWQSICFIFSSLITLAISVLPHSFTLARNMELKGQKSLISWNAVRKKSHKQLIEEAKEYSENDQMEDILNEHLAGSRITNMLHIYFGVGIVVYLIGLCVFLFPLFT